MSRQVSPENRYIADHIVNDFTIVVVDRLLAGVYSELAWPIRFMHGSNQELFDRFKDYVEEDEAKLKKKLESIRYYIDAEDTLDFVTGSARVERVSLKTQCALDTRR